MDPAEASADANSARDARFETLAEIARRRYAVAVAAALSAKESDASFARGFEREDIDRAFTDAKQKIGFDPDVPEDMRLRQRGVLAADLNQLADALSALDKQIAQKEATSKRLDMSIAFQEPADDHAGRTREDAAGRDRP